MLLLLLLYTAAEVSTKGAAAKWSSFLDLTTGRTWLTT